MQLAEQTIDNDIRQIKARYGIVGNSPALTAALQRTLKVAPIDLTVLVNGESGSGKEFFPKIIHNNSPRKHSKYIAVNCGAIPEGTIDSELFGHEKGSFTGAISSRKGYFEEADGGTIFLDEVAELPLTTQARLLRVLESGEFIKVGSSTVQKTNVRIVAATNVDLPHAVAKGTFREDLYYRLSTVGIYIPPLRERGKDIMLLARKFASDFSDKYRTSGISFSEGARDALMRYSWPGNVRQLKNIIEQMSLFEAGKEIGSDTVLSYLPAAPSLVPALQSGSEHSYAKEREMLFSMIFSLQRRLDELQQELDSGNNAKVAHSATGNDKSSGFMPVKADAYNFTPFTEAHNDSSGEREVNDTPHVEIPCESAPTTDHSANISNISEAESAPSEDKSSRESSMSLEENEKKMIKKALAEAGGRRKEAADRLGISERTLYRKIRAYGLDDQQ